MARFLVTLCFSLLLLTQRLIGGEINLGAGWNLLTIPLVESSVDAKTYLSANLIGNVQKIWTYDDGWSYYSNSSATFTEFKPNRGYWFFMDSSGGTLQYNDGASIKGIEFLKSGWALGSFNQGKDLSSSGDVFLQENIKSEHELSNIAKVWSYGASDGGWKYFVPGSSGSLETIAKGRAL